LKTPTSRVGASVLSSSRSIKIVTICFMQCSSMPATRRYRLFSAGLPRCLHSAAGAVDGRPAVPGVVMHPRPRNRTSRGQGPRHTCGTLGRRAGRLGSG
jgi:hypothetical protein